jgi:outer membrane protein insertion porin family
MENGKLKIITPGHRARGFIFFALTLIALCGHAPAAAQHGVVDYGAPGKYVINDVAVTGVEVPDARELAQSVGIFVGDTITIPGSYLTSAVRQLVTVKRFTDADITFEPAGGDRVNLEIILKPMPRVSEWRFEGIRKGQASTLKDKDHMNLKVGNSATLSGYDITRHTNYIKNYYKEKGFRNATVEVRTVLDERYPGANLYIATFVIDRGPKVKVGRINFEGNEVYTDRRLRRTLKNTHQVGPNIFRNFKLRDKKYQEDKEVNLIDFYNSKGYRNATVTGDSVYYINPKRLGIDIDVFEGREYFYRNIRFVGNTIFPTESSENRPGLVEMLGIEKGDRYDRKALYKRLGIGAGSNPDDASTVNALYQNSGYLMASIEPVENIVGRDSIDLEIKIYEGKPFTVNKVEIYGNNSVDDEVIRRDIDVRPGELYSMNMLMSTMRRLTTMDHFEQMSVFPSIMPVNDHLVDMTYNLTEKASDQFEISGGFGAGMFIGSVGVHLRNVSSRRLFDRHAKWTPYPRGQNQTLSIRAQSNGRYYKAFSLNFLEPWLGGKKPVSLNVGSHFSDETTGSYLFQATNDYFRTFGVSVGVGRRLSWPDMFFELYNEVAYTAYSLKNWSDYFIMSNGRSNIFTVTSVLSRSTLDGWNIYPTGGSRFNLSLALTPPFSLLDGKDYSDTTMTEQDRYRWIEYHKWKFDWSWYTPMNKSNKLILKTAFEFGYLGAYNKNKLSPFEGFDMGGSGMTGYNMYGVDIIGMRGYEESSLTPVPTRRGDYARVYNKFTAELRYPIMLNGPTQMFGLVFAEGGNAFRGWKEYNPFDLKRALGVGLRVNLPMVGMMGLDWGYGFDAAAEETKPHGGQLTFSFGGQF